MRDRGSGGIGASMHDRGSGAMGAPMRTGAREYASIGSMRSSGGIGASMRDRGSGAQAQRRLWLTRTDNLPRNVAVDPTVVPLGWVQIFAYMFVYGFRLRLLEKGLKIPWIPQ